jgi:hypothetical protein
VQGTLPAFSRGLKLVRIGVFLQLLQLVLSVVVTVKALGVDDASDAQDAMKWTEYFILANIAAVLAMFIGVARAVPELKRAGEDLTKVLAAAAGFGIATVALLWIYNALSTFIAVVMDPEASPDAVLAGIERFEYIRFVVITKDLAYGVGLVSLIGIVRRAAIVNDQLGLRDLAASMGRALLVMVIADLFYQLTYGEHGGIGILGLVGSLLVVGYWIYCHARLQRFLEDAAYFMSEPHNLPTATVISAASTAPAHAPKPAPRARTQPSPPRASTSPVVVVAPPPRPEPPRAPSSAGDEDGPQFLK